MSENIKQGDAFSWVHQLEYDDGTFVDLRIASSVYMIAVMYGSSTAKINKECQILNATNGLISVNLSPEDTEDAGMYKMMFRCYLTGDDVLTIPSSSVLWLHIEESYTE